MIRGICGSDAFAEWLESQVAVEFQFAHGSGDHGEVAAEIDEVRGERVHQATEYGRLAVFTLDRKQPDLHGLAMRRQEGIEVRKLLVEQVTGRVRWRESMIWLAEEGGVTRFAEAGAGKVLTGMAKRIAPDAEAVALNAPEDLEAFAKSL